MGLAAGDLNSLVQVERPSGEKDEAGGPLGTWTKVGEMWADIGNETGLGAIRSSLQGNVPSSIGRYSFRVRLESARALGINAGMRLVYDGLIFDVKGMVRDLKRRDRAYIITEQGGSDG